MTKETMLTKWMTKSFTYTGMDGKQYETTNLRELGIAIVATPFVLVAMLVVVGLIIAVGAL